MKKTVLCIIGLAFFLSAQSQEIRFGLKGGLNVGSLKFESPFYDTKNVRKIGFYVGARAELGLTQKIAIQGEAIYQNFGGEFEETRYESGYHYEWLDDINMYEVSIPIVLKYYIISDKLSLNGGFSVGYIFGAINDYSYSADGYEYDSDIEDLMDEEVKHLQYGLSVGAELRVTDNIFMDLRYNIGLTDLSNDASWFEDSEMKSTVLQIGIGYRF